MVGALCLQIHLNYLTSLQRGEHHRVQRLELRGPEGRQVISFMAISRMNPCAAARNFEDGESVRLSLGPY